MKGRPVRSMVVPVRLNSAERAALGEKAAVCGVSVSAMLRSAALKQKITPARPKLDLDAVRELSAIGNNVNQLARALNFALAQGSIDPVLAENIGRALKGINEAMTAIAEEVIGP